MEKAYNKFLIEVKGYKEPKFGSFEYLNIQAGYCTIKKLMDEDDNFKEALNHLVSMTVKEAVKNEHIKLSN